MLHIRGYKKEDRWLVSVSLKLQQQGGDHCNQTKLYCGKSNGLGKPYKNKSKEGYFYQKGKTHCGVSNPNYTVNCTQRVPQNKEVRSFSAETPPSL